MFHDSRWSLVPDVASVGVVAARSRRFCRSRSSTERTYIGIHSAFTSVRGRRERARARRNDDTRHSRHACAEETIEPLASLSFSLSLLLASVSRVLPVWRLLLPFRLFLFLCCVCRTPRLVSSTARGLPAKLNKHSYLHSISGALTSLDNPATDSSSSHVRASSEPRPSFRYTHTSRDRRFTGHDFLSVASDRRPTRFIPPRLSSTPPSVLLVLEDRGHESSSSSSSSS